MIEYTFFILNIRLIFCAKLGIAVHEWNRETVSADSILMLYIHFPLSFPDTSGAS